MSLQSILTSIRKRDYATANEGVTAILHRKVASQLAEEKKHLISEAEKKCELCGSDKDLRVADDETVLCKSCDVDE